MNAGFGFSAVYPGMQEAQSTYLQNQLRETQVEDAKIEQQGREAFGRALAASGLVPGAQQMPATSQQGIPQTRMNPSMDPNKVYRNDEPSPLDPVGAPAAQGPSLQGQGRQGAGLQGPSQQPGSPFGKFDWQTVAQRVVQANPGANPAVVAKAITMAMPLMNFQAQQEWRQVELQMKQQEMGARREETRMLEEGRNKRAGLTGSPSSQAFRQWMINNPDATPTEISQKLEEFGKGGKGGPIAGRTPSGVAVSRYLEENPEATAEEIAAFTKTLKPPSATELRQKSADQAVDSVATQIRELISTVEKNPQKTGVGGMVSRVGELAKGLAGVPSDTTASDIETKIRLIQNQLPRVIQGTARLSKDERANMEAIVRGLNWNAYDKNTISALKEVLRVLGDKKSDASTGGGLKPMTADVKAKMEEAIRQGHSRADVEKYLRNQGYDPAR